MTKLKAVRLVRDGTRFRIMTTKKYGTLPMDTVAEAMAMAASCDWVITNLAEFEDQ